MIKLLDGMPKNVVVASATGHVSEDDYEDVLIPAVKAALEDSDKIRLLYVLGEEFEGYEAEAALDDAKMGMHLWTSFDRIGLVTDHGAYRTMTKAFGFLMPGQVRTFTNNQLEEAKVWVVAD